MKLSSLYRIYKKIIIFFLLIKKICYSNYQMIKEKFKNQKIIVFDLSEEQFDDFLNPIILHLKKLNENSKEIQIYYALNLNSFKSEKEKDKIILKYKTDKKKLIIIDYLFILPFVDVFMSSHFYSKASKFTKKINIPRGVGKWFIPPKSYFKNFDIHFLTGPLHKEQVLDSINIYKIKKKIDFFEIGFPKIDDLYNQIYSHNEILNKLKLDQNKKTILFSPTWDPGMLLSDFGIDCAKSILERYENFNLIVKLHPSSLVSSKHEHFRFYTHGIDWRKEFSKLESYKNFKFCEASNSNEVLAVSDIMITDVSSISYEYLVQKKPVFFYDSPKFFDKEINIFYEQFQNKTEFIGNPRNNPRINCGRNLGHVFYDLDDLNKLIDLYQENMSLFNLKDEAFIDNLFYNIGNSKKIAGEKLNQILKDDKNI